MEPEPLMGETFAKVAQALAEAGIMSDSAVLEALVFGESAELDSHRILITLTKFVAGHNRAIEIIAKDVDQLRARIDAEAA
jgi:hypothetical protein